MYELNLLYVCMGKNIVNIYRFRYYLCFLSTTGVLEYIYYCTQYFSKLPYLHENDPILTSCLTLSSKFYAEGIFSLCLIGSLEMYSWLTSPLQKLVST